MILLSRRISQGVELGIVRDVRANVISVSQNPISPGIQDPHLIGRLQGSLLAVFRSEERSGVRCAIRNDGIIGGDSERLSGIDIFADFGESERRVGRVVVDISRGYICPLVEEFNQEGRVLRRWSCGDYSQDEASGLWFPKACTYEERLKSSEELYSTIDYEFDPVATRLNQVYSADVFAIPVDSGMGVSSTVDSAQGSWVATCDFEFKIDDVGTLPGALCLVKPEVSHRPARRPMGSETLRGRWIWLIVVNMTIFAIVAFLVVRRRFNHVVSCLLIVLPVGLSSTTGCSPTAQRLSTESNPISVLPTRVDFGEIATSGRGGMVNVMGAMERR